MFVKHYVARRLLVAIAVGWLTSGAPLAVAQSSTPYFPLSGDFGSPSSSQVVGDDIQLVSHLRQPEMVLASDNGMYASYGPAPEPAAWAARGCDSCSQPSAQCCCPPCRPWWAHRTRVWGEFLYLHPTDADVTHAQQQDGIGGAGTVPFGTVGTVGPDYEPAYRVGADVAFTDCGSLFLSFTGFESSAVDTVEPPVIPGGGGAVGSFLHHPNAAITASAGPVTTFLDIDFRLADFGYRRVWRAGKQYVINWSLGGRYGYLDQSLLQEGVFAGGSQGQINTASNIRFEGGGLRFGLDGERRFGGGCWSVYGNANVSPMTGRVHADYTMQNETTEVLLARAEWKDDRIVTTLDYEAGLAWTGPRGCWRFSAGYHVAHWFNAVTTDTFIDAVRNDNYVDVEGPLSFSGLVSRVECRW